MESMKYESGVVTGELPVPYTLQFTNTTPYLFQIQNLFWQLGPVFLFPIIGTVWALIYALLKRDWKLLILLSFPLSYFAYIGSWHTKFIRYMTPLLPFIIIFGSFFLLYMHRQLAELTSKSNHESKLTKNIAQVLIYTWRGALGLMVGLTIIWAIGFFSIYTRPQTRIAASEWIYRNIPAGSFILTEHWDDGLPIPLPNYFSGQYRYEQLTIYEPDNQAKIDYYGEKLSQGDYIVINSRRLYGTLMHLPQKYPITSRYYQLLFTGELGYQEVAEFTSYPGIFNIEVNDDSSEETFQVYEHPKVMVFQNVSRLTPEEIAQKLQ